jgi:transposase-like protein
MTAQLIPNKFSPNRYKKDLKLQIIKEADDTGNFLEVCSKYKVNPSSVYRWKKALDIGVTQFLGPERPKIHIRLKELETEIIRLKDIIVDLTDENVKLRKHYGKKITLKTKGK